MGTRKIKDAKDLTTDELIYFKSHAKATYTSDGSTVLDKLENLEDTLKTKQATLVPGINIRTINGESLLGEGNIDIEGGGGGTYTPNAADDARVDVQSVKAEDLKGKSYSEVLDILLFPEYGANAGSLPTIAISNSNETLEVGTSIGDASYSITSYGTAYRYIKNGDTYVSGNYGYTTPTVTTTKGNKVILGTSSRTTAATSYTVSGPTTDELYDGKYLFKSKGNGTNTTPLAVGTVTKNLAATSATITGVYKGGKDGTKSDYVCIKNDGTLSNSVKGTYGKTLTLSLLTDETTDADHAFKELGEKSVELYVPSGVTYSVKLVATKFNAGNGNFENDSDLTNKLNALSVAQSDKTFVDAAGVDYSVKSFSIDTSSVTTGGKFRVSMIITKN